MKKKKSQKKKKKSLLFSFFFLEEAFRDGVRHQLLSSSPELLKGFLGTANSEETPQTEIMPERHIFHLIGGMSRESPGGSSGNVITKEE